MVLLDGRKLSTEILAQLREEVATMPKPVRLAVVMVGKDPAISKFIEQKKKAAGSIGVEVRLYPFAALITTNELRKRIAEIVHEEKNTGVIVQLPLPAHINKQYILNAVVPQKDVDVLSSRSLGNFIVGKSSILPPVTGAVKAFFEAYGIDYRKKQIVVVGWGNLVGRPVTLWLLNEGATVSVVSNATANPEEFLSRAEIVISGVGKPKCITGDMVRDGVVVIDAGTSESEGKLVGDVDFESVAPKASHITPVPGGLGPLTVAMLLKNVVTLAKEQ